MDPWYWPVTYLCDGSEQSPVYCFSHALFVYELQQHSLRKGMHKSALFSTLKKRDMVSLSNGINDCSNIHWHKWLFKYTLAQMTVQIYTGTNDCSNIHWHKCCSNIHWHKWLFKYTLAQMTVQIFTGTNGVQIYTGTNDCSNIHWHKWLFKYTWMTVRQTLQKWLRPYAQRCEHMRTQHCKCILEARHNKKAHIHTVSLGSGLQHTHIYTHTHTHTHTHHFIYS